MYRNLVIVGLVAGALGAAAGALAAGGGSNVEGVTSAQGPLRLENGRLLTEDGRPVGDCDGAARCTLDYPLDDGQISAAGVITPGRASTLQVTGGAGAYAGAFGRAVVAGDLQDMTVEFTVVLPG